MAGPGAISSHPLPPRVSTSDESSVENQTVYKKPAFKPNPKSGKGSRKKKSENEEFPDESDADHAPLGGKGDDDSDEDGESGGVDDDGIPLDLAGKNPKKRPASCATQKKPAGKSRKKDEAGTYISMLSMLALESIGEIMQNIAWPGGTYPIPVCHWFFEFGPGGSWSHGRSGCEVPWSWN